MIKKKQSGFTIVELLIVIVVIAILAAITIVAYNGITQRARVATVSSDLEGAAKQLAIDQTLNSAYPATVAAANNGAGLKASPGTTYQYSVNNSVTPQTFCLTATNGSTSYYTTQNSTPTSGTCIITNLYPNPGVESNSTTFAAVNSTIVRDTSTSYTGSASLKITLSAYPISQSGATIYALGASAVPNTLAPNTTYQVSAYVYVPSATNIPIQLSVQGSGYASRTLGATSYKDGWIRLASSFTTNSAGSINIYLLNYATSTAGMVLWVDDVMLTATTSLTNYADGSSPGWAWTVPASANNSTSFGPAL